MDLKASETVSAGVIGRNKDSPFQILDVRSINGVSSSFHNPPAFEDTGAMSDASSGSEKALVIDMADEEEPEHEADEPETRKVTISENTESKRKEEATVAEVRKDRVSRRKSQHVPIATDDVVFGVPVTHRDTKNDPRFASLKCIAKHIVLLREIINHILERRFDRNFNFDAANTDRSILAQLRRWINCYEKIKKESADEKAILEKAESQ